MQNPTPILLELFHFKTIEKKAYLYQKNMFWHIQNHLQHFGQIQNHYRTIFKKLCIQNYVLYKEPDGSTVHW